MFVDKFLEIEGLVSPAEAGEDGLDVRHGHPQGPEQPGDSSDTNYIILKTCIDLAF